MIAFHSDTQIIHLFWTQYSESVFYAKKFLWCLYFQSKHIPMSVKAIDRLIKKLDTDGDGEVDFKLRQKQNMVSNN